ncbi:MAG: 30S ribosomal protein S18 [Planctomycetes bacterium]|nr:30S ribosomal protein S18 [Planctomycetota bacterium]
MREKREKREKRDKKKFKRFQARTCRFERMGVELIDWKDVATLQRLCTGQSMVLARKRSGTSALFQRKVKEAIKRARFMALIPYEGS